MKQLKNVNSIEKTKFYVSYSQQNLRFHNSKLFLHHKQYFTIMPVNFYLTKRFFPHDITLIASVVGESAVGHGIGGIDIPAKWRASLKACRRSKR